MGIAAIPTEQLAWAPVVLILLGVLAWEALRYRARRICRAHPKPVRMSKVREADEDVWLTDGQELEEDLGAVFHQVYVCPECQAVKTFALRQPFSRYKFCGVCKHYTSTEQRKVLSQPSNGRPGTMKVHTSCRHCGYENTDQRPYMPIGYSHGQRRGRH